MELFQYHQLVMKEMHNRGYKPNELWGNSLYRGENCEPYLALPDISEFNTPIYTEHDDEYLTECLANLLAKNIDLLSLYK